MTAQTFSRSRAAKLLNTATDATQPESVRLLALAHLGKIAEEQNALLGDLAFDTSAKDEEIASLEAIVAAQGLELEASAQALKEASALAQRVYAKLLEERAAQAPAKAEATFAPPVVETPAHEAPCESSKDEAIVAPQVKVKRPIMSKVRPIIFWSYPEHARLRELVRQGLAKGYIALRLSREFGRTITDTMVSRKMGALNLRYA